MKKALTSIDINILIIKIKLLLFITIICLIHLATFAQEQAENYQTKINIIETYGEPFWKGEGEQRGVWYYPQQRMFVFFDKGKVVRIDMVTGEKI